MCRLHCYTCLRNNAANRGAMPGNDAELGLSEEAITSALEAARARVARAERERAELDGAMAAAREELRLLERLLALRRDGAVGGTGQGGEAEGPALRDARVEGKHPVVHAVV